MFVKTTLNFYVTAIMAETLKSITPIVLAIVGGAIAICALVNPNVTSEKFAAAMGTVATFAAGAAGLASPQRGKD